LQQAADALVQRLLSFALDGKVADTVALQAIRDAVDRAGLSPKAGIEVEVALKPREQVLESLGPIQSGSRAEHRKSIGRTDDSLADSHTLPPANDDLVVDAEIVDDGDELIATMRSHARVESDDGLLIPPDSDEHGSAFDTASGINPLLPPEPPPKGLMSLEDSVAEQGRMRRGSAPSGPERARDGAACVAGWATMNCVVTHCV
jgi:hypothetical protein